MDKRLWLIVADVLTTYGDTLTYSVRMYAEDAGAAWMKFTQSFDEGTSWQAISVTEVMRNE